MNTADLIIQARERLWNAVYRLESFIAVGGTANDLARILRDCYAATAALQTAERQARGVPEPKQGDS